MRYQTIQTISRATPGGYSAFAATLAQMANSLGKWAAVKNEYVDERLQEFNDALENDDMSFNVLDIAKKVFLRNEGPRGGILSNLPPEFIAEMSRILQPEQCENRNAVAVTFESRWEEGTVSTDAYLDLDTGVVFGIVESDAGEDYEHLIGEFVLVGGREVSVELDPDNNFRIDSPTLAAINVEVRESAFERPRC
jgi:hypothetical protein